VNFDVVVFGISIVTMPSCFIAVNRVLWFIPSLIDEYNPNPIDAQAIRTVVIKNAPTGGKTEQHSLKREP
jgi:hypothetical protein